VIFGLYTVLRDISRNSVFFGADVSFLGIIIIKKVIILSENVVLLRVPRVRILSLKINFFLLYSHTRRFSLDEALRLICVIN